MAIIGIKSLIYGVEDVPLSTRFFQDFGLSLKSGSAQEALFELPDGSTVVIRPFQDVRHPKSVLSRPGVLEVVWGVDTLESLEALRKNLGRDREVRIDDEGGLHFLTDCGLPMALQYFRKRPIVHAPDPLNAPGVVNRLNTHRKWRRRAHPKSMQHVVFAVKDARKSFEFFRNRLGFRLTDYQKGFGLYSRADGSNSHHSLFLLNADLPFPDLDGTPCFHHANFGVEDLDEIMVGANYMQRRGWPPSHLGLGRHRVDSALFLYLPCPAGGEAEYGADSDCVDDAWVPREWNIPLFGYAHFVHNLPDWLKEEPKWEFRYLDAAAPPEA